MSAGTIVISGGILAGVILLCIVAVLCYCRLQVPLCNCIVFCFCFLNGLGSAFKMQGEGWAMRLVQSEIKIRFITIWGIFLKKHGDINYLMII